MPFPALSWKSSVYKQCHQLETRSLLRAVLRECTYLPNPVARREIPKQVLFRFRNRNSSARQYLEQAADEQASAAERHGAAQELHARLKKGYKALRYLQRANDGELKQLTHILYLAYGRTGRRRHELLEPLLRPDPTIPVPLADEQTPKKYDLTTISLPPLLEPPNKPARDGFLTYPKSRSFAKLAALARAPQRMPQLANPALPPMRGPDAYICRMPAINSWGEPMPRKRAENFVKRWVGWFLERVAPPLPEGEWEGLRGFVAGENLEGCFRERRRKVGEWAGGLTAFDVEKVLKVKDAGIDLDCHGERSKLRGPDQWLTSPEAMDRAMQHILEDNLRLNRPLHKTLSPLGRRGHSITPRRIRRILLRVFQQCPKITRADDGVRWKVEWGNGLGRAGKQAAPVGFERLLK